MFGFGKSAQALFDEGKRAFDAQDHKGALEKLYAVTQKAPKDFVLCARAYVWIGEACEMLGEAKAAREVRALALTLFTLATSAVAERTIAIARLRASEGIAADEPDDVVVARAWEIDAALKLREGDVQGCVVATRGATSTLAGVFGPDNARQAAVLSRSARLMAIMAPKELASPVESLVDAALRIADKTAVPASVRVELFESRSIVRMANGNTGGAFTALHAAVEALDDDCGDRNVYLRANLAELQRARGEFDAARATLERARAFASKGSANEAKVVGDVAWLFSRQNRDDEAATAFEEAFALFRAAGSLDVDVVFRTRYEQWARETGRSVPSAPV